MRARLQLRRFSSRFPGFSDPEGTFTIETKNDVDRRSKPGACDPFTTSDVTPRDDINSPKYGPNGAYIDTNDPRGRDIHGGGSALADPFAPRQGWKPTYGCTRGQNEDVQEMNRRIRRYKTRNPDKNIPYIRKW